MLTPEQRRQLNAAIDQSLARTRQNLALAATRALSSHQRETAAQIENFLKQAQATRASDLEGSRSLAERADLLSRELVQSLR